MIACGRTDKGSRPAERNHNNPTQRVPEQGRCTGSFPKGLGISSAIVAPARCLVYTILFDKNRALNPAARKTIPANPSSGNRLAVFGRCFMLAVFGSCSIGIAVGG